MNEKHKKIQIGYKVLISAEFLMFKTWKRHWCLWPGEKQLAEKVHTRKPNLSD